MSQYADVFIRWASTAQGGRATPASLRADGSQSYRPHFRVGAKGAYLGVAFLDGEPAVAAPGAEGTATVALIYTETGVDYSALEPGARFEVLEGPHVVGRGVVQRRWQSDDAWRARPAG